MKAESVSVEKAKTMISCEILGRCTFHHPAFRLIKEEEEEQVKMDFLCGI